MIFINCCCAADLIYLSIYLFVMLSPSPAKPVITYLWIGDDPLPEKYKQKLLVLDYPFQLVQNCDLIIQKMQKVLGRRITHKTLYFNQLADICRYSYIYFNGGTYSDLDVTLNYTCYQQLIANESNAWPTMIDYKMNQILDNYFFYQQKESKTLRWLISNFDAHLELNLINVFYVKGTMPGFNMGNINQCLKHSYDRTFLKNTYKVQQRKIPLQLTCWLITWALMLVIAFVFYCKFKSSFSNDIQILRRYNSVEMGMENGIL